MDSILSLILKKRANNLFNGMDLYQIDLEITDIYLTDQDLLTVYQASSPAKQYISPKFILGNFITVTCTEI